VGDTWRVGDRSVRVAAVDPAAGTVTLDLLTGDKVTASRTLGPVRNELLIEDTTARKALVFEDGDMVAFLSPFPAAFEGGKANLKVYGQAFSLAYGSDYARDPRFAVYPVGCPTGHNFGFMLVNKQEIRIKPGQSVEGPEDYFKVVVDRIENGTVAAWHVADKEGNRSINLGGPNVANIDLVLGQGRVAGQAILKDVGRAMLARSYDTSRRLEAAAPAASGAPVAAAMAPPPAPLPAPLPATVAAPAHAPGSPLSPTVITAVAVLAIGAGAVGYEVGRRRKAG